MAMIKIIPKLKNSQGSLDDYRFASTGTMVDLSEYSKHSTTSDLAITTSDNVSVAIGKLEKALDGKQPSGSYLTPTSQLDATLLVGTIPPECYTNTTYNVFVGSGASAAAGLVPKPSTTAGTTKYLREDGTWAVPPDNDTVYTHPTTSGNKHIPSGGSAGQILRWSADGTAVWGADNDTTYGVFVGSGSSAASGLVPSPGPTAGDTKYLREDGTWAVPEPSIVYTASDGIALTDTNFTNSGVRAISSGTNNGTISVNTNGTTDEVAITGLASGAFAEAYTHPTTSGNKHIPSGGSSGQILKYSADGTAVWANEYSYTHPTTSGNKHIPSGGSSGQILRWSADGTAVWGADNNTTYTDFVGSGASAAAGLVPKPPTTVGTSKYLREDGSWTVPPNDNTIYTGSDGITLTGTNFTNSGVRSIATGGTNGTISVNTNGTSTNIAVKGLGSAAYTASTDYAADDHTHTYSDVGAAAATHTHPTSQITDFPTIPTISDTYSGTSSDGMSGKAVKSAIDAALTSAYKPSGSLAYASLPTLSASVMGNVYNVTDAFTIDNRFVEYDSSKTKTFPAGTEVAVINTGTSGSPTYKFSVMSGFIDLSGYQLTTTSVTHTQNTAAGATNKPVYISTSGVATAISYEINTNVPSDAKFTDTVYTHPTTSGNKHIPSGGSSGQILKWSADGTATWAAEYSYTHPTTSGNKHIPSGGSSGQILRWSADGTAAWGADNNTTYSVFVGSGSSAASGLVPAPGSTAGTTKYLCEDGTWTVPPDTKYTHPTGAGYNHIPSGGSSGQILKYSSSGVAVWAAEYSYTHPTTSGNKHIPSGGSSGQILRWSADGTAAWGADNDTKYSNFVGSGSSAAAGLVPAPSTTAGTTKYLREDGTWAVPPNDNTDVKVTSTTTSPSSATVWYPISSTSATTETNTTVKNAGFNVTTLTGTTSAEGRSEISLGNTTATGTAGNLTGKVNLYNDKGSYATIAPHAGDTTDRTLYTPKASGTLVAHTTNTAVGSTSNPVYVTADGVVTAISYTIAKSVPSDAKFTDTVYTHPTTSGNKHIPSGGSSGQILKWASDGTATWANEYSYTHPTTSGNKHIPSGGSSGQILKWSADGTAAWAAEYSYIHPASGVTADSYGPSADASPAHSGTFYVPYLTVDANGHITAASTKTITLPAQYTHPTGAGNNHIPSGGSSGQVLKYGGSSGTATWANEYSYTHPNTVTAGTVGTSSATSGNTLAVPYITYNANGHITATGTHTHTVTGFLTSHQTIKQDGLTGATGNRYGACDTAAATAAKTVSVTSGTPALEAGLKVTVKFTNANTAGTPTLNVNSLGAKNIFHNGAQITTGGNKALLAGVCDFVYDGTQFHLVGNYIDTNTVYTHPNSGATAGSYGPSDNASPAHGAGFSVPYVTINAAGHVTAASTKTITLPAQYVHPTGAGNNHIPSGGSSGQILKYSASGVAVWANEYSYTHPTTSGNKHIPSGGSSGQILKWSADGTATWAAEYSYTHPSDGANTGNFGPSANASPAHGAGFSVPYITVNAAGHVTAASTKTITLPAQYVHPTGAGNNHIPSGGSSGQFLKWSSSGVAVWAADNNTLNTAGSTDTSSKIFLIGATSQAANPQTYSDNEVYVTSGVLTTKSVQVGGTACTLQYNATNKSVDFVFA